LESKIKNYISENRVCQTTSVDISNFIDVSDNKIEQVLRKVIEDSNELESKLLMLTDVQFSIRRKIAEANEKYGINNLINDRVTMLAKIKIINDRLNAEEVQSLASIKIKVNHIVDNVSSSYLMSDGKIHIGNRYGKDEELKSILTEGVELIDDRIAGINLSETISVPAEYLRFKEL